MSALMSLSIEEKKDILKNLVIKRSKKFNKEYSKLLKIIENNYFLKNYEKKLKDLKDEFKRELNSINTHDVDWEVHESKGAEIERKFNKKLLDIKYKINTLLDSFNELKNLYKEYEKIYKEMMNILENNEKYKNLISEINKFEMPKVSDINEINKAKEILKQELKKIEEIKKRCQIISSYKFNFKEKKFAFVNELDDILEKIKLLSQKEYQRIKSLETDEKLKIKEAKVIYQRLVYSQIYKDEIEAILDDVPTYLREKFENLKQKEILYKDEYEKLLDEYYNQESKNISVDKIVKAFENAGYKFEDVVLNEKGYIDTDKKEYKIAYKIENNKFSLAFTRFIDKDTQINEYEKEKDKQMAKKWCGDFDKIAENLKKQGINLNKEIVKEPDEIEIRYEVVESKISNQNYKLEHYNTNIKENKQ